MLENVVEKYLTRRVKELGGITRKASFLAHRGAPDRLVLFPGILVWVELKATGKKLSPLQAVEHATLEKFGQRVYVCDSIETIERVLKEILCNENTT